MRQTDYREEKPDQASKDPSAVNRVLYLWCMWKRFWQRRCQKQRYENPRRFFTHLFLWGMRVQPSWHHKQIWSGPQLQLDLRSIRSVLQQNGQQPSTPSCPAWKTRGQSDYRWRYQQHLNQDPTQSSDVPCYHPQRPTELQPIRRFYLTIPRPEPCIDNIDSPSVQRKQLATVSKTGTTLPYMRWERPPFQRWYGPSTDSRPQPSRSTCLLVLSYGTSRLECCSITILARTTPHQNRRRLGEVSGGVEPNDTLEYIRQQRPNTKLVVHLLTNVTFYLNKLIQHPIGARVVFSRLFPATSRLGVFSWWSPCTLYRQPMLFPMAGRTSLSSSEGRRSSSEDVIQTVSTVPIDCFQGFPGCDVGWFGGIGAVVQLACVCVWLTRNRSWWHRSSVGTTLSLQLPGDYEFEPVWRPFQLRQ